MESVWDYPRPPRVEAAARRVRIVHGERTIVDTTDVLRVLETSHPPSYYVPLAAVAPGAVEPSDSRSTVCEWKGKATYLDVVVAGQRVLGAAWTYEDPEEGFERLAHRVAFYAQALDACWVDEERVLAQQGTFYGGWITSDLRGPFKGAPGTMGW